MSASPAKYTLSSSFDVNDYVKATNDAAKRTRAITIVLVIATGLICLGWYNSLIWSWPIDRVRRAYDTDDPAILRLLDLERRPSLRPDNDSQKESPADEFRKDLRLAVSRA